jgi:hypothetical protein
LKQLFELVRQALFLLRDVQQNKEDIAKLRRELDETHDAVRALAFELERVAERESHERERLALKLETILLRFERRLPPGKPPKDRT